MWRFCCGAYTNVHKCELLSLAAAERIISFRFSKSCVARARLLPRWFFFFLLLFRAVFSFVFICFVIQGVHRALRLQQTPNKLLRGSGTHFLRIFSVFFQTTGGVDKLLHAAVADVLKKKAPTHCCSPHMYVAFFRINISICTGFLRREFTQGGVRGGLPPQHQSSLHLSAGREARRIQGSCARSAAGEHSLPLRRAQRAGYFFNAGKFCYNARELY